MARWPSPRAIQRIAETGIKLASHISDFWPTTGEPRKRQLAIYGNSNAFKRASDLLARDEGYPGEVVELQLRHILAVWDQSDLTPWPPSLETREWQGWSEETERVFMALVYFVNESCGALRVGRVPESFDGEHVDAILGLSRRLLQLIHFTPNELQQLILNALDGRAMFGEDLRAHLGCSRETLYGKGGEGGLTELKEFGLVVNDRRRGGYYRPDRPPT